MAGVPFMVLEKEPKYSLGYDSLQQLDGLPIYYGPSGRISHCEIVLFGDSGF